MPSYISVQVLFVCIKHRFCHLFKGSSVHVRNDAFFRSCNSSTCIEGGFSVAKVCSVFATECLCHLVEMLAVFQSRMQLFNRFKLDRDLVITILAAIVLEERQHAAGSHEPKAWFLLRVFLYHQKLNSRDLLWSF